MIRFSCSDYTFPLLGRLESFQVVRALGFEYIDLGLFARTSHLAPQLLMENPKGFTQDLLSDLQRADLKVADVFLQIGEHPGLSACNDPSAAVRAANNEVFRHALDLCVSLGAAHMTGLPGVPHEGDRALHLAADESLRRKDAAANAGVVYSVEPHIGSICATVEDTLEFLSAAPGLTLTLDYGHFIARGETNESVHRLLPYASHFHARGGADRRLQTSVAENKIDFAAILPRLKQLNFKGFLTLEYVWVDWEGCNCVDNVSETVELRRLLETIL